MKKIIILPLLILSILFSTLSSYASTLITDKEDKWENIGEDWYYIGEKLVPGWTKDSGYWYYTDENNKMIVGTKWISGESYFFNDGTYENLPYGAMIEKNQIEYKEKDTGSISYLEISKRNTDYDNVIIILPDISEEYNDYREYGCYLADNRSLVLIPNLYSVDSNYEVATIPEIITRSSDNITKLLKLYNIDENTKINIIGTSVGGMVGAYYTYKDEYKIDKLAMILSTPDFTSLEHSAFYYTYNNGIQITKIDKKEVDKDFKKITPLNNVLKLLNTNVYMINDKEDKYIPYEKAKQFYNDMKNEMNIKFVTLNSNGHKISENMFKTALEFILE